MFPMLNAFIFLFRNLHKFVYKHNANSATYKAHTEKKKTETNRKRKISYYSPLRVIGILHHRVVYTSPRQSVCMPKQFYLFLDFTTKSL